MLFVWAVEKIYSMEVPYLANVLNLACKTSHIKREWYEENWKKWRKNRFSTYSS